MKRSLLDIVFASEKRKTTLLILQEGPQEMGTLLELLKTTRQSLLPQIRILEEHHLVSQFNDTYELTTIGSLLVDKIAPLLSTLEVLDVDIDYWGTHNFDFVPPYLLKRINDLQECEIITPSLTELYSLHKTYHETKITESIYSVGNLFYPDYQSRFTEMIDNKISINYIISENLFNKVRTESTEHFKLFIKSGYFNLYVYNKKMNFLFFTFDDFHIVINPIKNDGDLDNKYLLCSTENALKWGKDLFDYYLKDSKPINKI
ncbi:helix-turn-helix transcriptional regulator [Methanolobus halotolerans]|uniref:Transcriptional regulator n=1 Tax=Methanolobus halotolerans TaxID=2052935 RepID=A0A4E0PVI8_9EURY|nr:winged helix-turn-helix domain-containing protein [Methanolobus halotolerans]TGC09368.1 transcriptional regulator [Methanolobus halotolerans]